MAALRIDVLTLFPEMFAGPLQAGLLGKALREGLLTVELTQIRDFATDKHRTVDDAPYGGGPGMVMKCEPLVAAAEGLRDRNSLERVVMLSPRGRSLTQAMIREWAAAPDLVLVCGRYEGIDERVAKALGAEEVSIGDYVLSGGEMPALVIIEALSRMIPGVVGNFESVETDSFYNGILGPPQYTRPQEFRGMEVPEVLREGNHAVIERWRRKEAIRQTMRVRPDLLDRCAGDDTKLIRELKREQDAPLEGETP